MRTVARQFHAGAAERPSVRHHPGTAACRAFAPPPADPQWPKFAGSDRSVPVEARSMRRQTPFQVIGDGPGQDPLDGIADDARRGDAAAIELFIQLARENTTARACLLIRNHAIGRIDAWLISILARPVPHVRARIVADAGQVLATRRTLPDGPAFAVLDHGERHHLEKMIRPFIGWVKWPKNGKSLKLLKIVLQFYPLETANVPR
ncbi:hypothetical protein ACFFP0_00755 [Rhizobium puerariae]|uniref:Uncharacterized protein n=1 Tax=Rhizobium puerariae TaxID=1585791 RepID=A0ABV6A9Q6_9HYPH